MIFSGGGSPRQFRAPIGPKTRLTRRRHRRKGKAGAQGSAEEEPEAEEVRLLQTPPPRAVAPYLPKTETEDSQLRFLIYHCK